MFPTTTTVHDFSDDVDQSMPFAADGWREHPTEADLDTFAADVAMAEYEADLAHQRTHCDNCGCESSGCDLFGTHQPYCDRCVLEQAIGTCGIDLALDVADELQTARNRSKAYAETRRLCPGLYPA